MPLWWRRSGGRRALLLLGVALLLGGTLLRSGAPARAERDELLPHASPTALAHRLADFSYLASLDPLVEQWTVEEEWSNYTSWRYEVAYSCGARCSGAVALVAHDAHRDHRQHRVHARDTRCTRPPLLPWPRFCEETETKTVIEGEEGGVRVRDEVRAWGGAAPAARAAALLAARAHLLRDLT